jgi:glycosyltransferase involved in cell wall biosynthesis
LRIAQIAPLDESVPPQFYGGTERVVSYLTEELVRQGHQVTLFASGDSVTAAELVSCCDTALRINRSIEWPLPYNVMQLEQVRRRADTFDVLHFHGNILYFPLVRAIRQKTITTLHGRLDLPDLIALHLTFPEIPMVSISDAQRQPLPSINWVATVPHGLPRDLLPYRVPAARGYLAFLGRISPEKRPDRAIEIAARAGMPLKIAAKISTADIGYWRDVIRPMVEQNPQIEFIGEINETQKAAFLGNASALLFPIDWPEPFGLVMIEAMSCGTPVIGFRGGSVPEVIENGASGFVVSSTAEAVAAIEKVERLDRCLVRSEFERRFTVERMAQHYLALYEQALSGKLPCRDRWR